MKARNSELDISVLPNNTDRLKMKPGQLLGSTSNTPLLGYSCAPKPYSISCTVHEKVSYKFLQDGIKQQNSTSKILVNNLFREIVLSSLVIIFKIELVTNSSHGTRKHIVDKNNSN